MFNKLNNLKTNHSYTPNIVLDIGAYHGHWTKSMMNIYPNAEYYLFEGIDYKELNRYETNNNVFIYKNILLNDREVEVDWYQEKNTGDSFFKELTHHFQNTKPIKRKTITLDTIINRDNILKNDKNIFIKIDCQGAEIPILKGSKTILNKTDFILLEMPLFGKYNEGIPNFLEHIQFMDSIGFCPFDIIDNHYINNFNMQIDMLFINKLHKLNNVVQQKLYK
jgi:FkbM family methyltransferase